MKCEQVFLIISAKVKLQLNKQLELKIVVAESSGSITCCIYIPHTNSINMLIGDCFVRGALRSIDP